MIVFNRIRQKLRQRHSLSQKSSGSPHKNRDCRGWSGCNGQCLVSRPDILVQESKVEQILLCSRSTFYAKIQIIFGVYIFV